MKMSQRPLKSYLYTSCSFDVFERDIIRLIKKKKNQSLKQRDYKFFFPLKK